MEILSGGASKLKLKAHRLVAWRASARNSVCHSRPLVGGNVEIYIYIYPLPAVAAKQAHQSTASVGSHIENNEGGSDGDWCVLSLILLLWVCFVFLAVFLLFFLALPPLCLSLCYDAWEPRGRPCCSENVKVVCEMTQPWRLARATCVSRAPSAKWNSIQTTPEVLDNLVPFREHNRTYFCRRGRIRTATWI